MPSKNLSNFETKEEQLKKFQKSIVDQEHVDLINSFIPQSEKYALKMKATITKEEIDRRTKELKDTNSCKWDAFSFFFHKKMNELTKKAGLRIV